VRSLCCTNQERRQLIPKADKLFYNAINITVLKGNDVVIGFPTQMCIIRKLNKMPFSIILLTIFAHSPFLFFFFLTKDEQVEHKDEQLNTRHFLNIGIYTHLQNQLR